MAKLIGVAVAMTLVMAIPSYAQQQDIEWKQIVNVPKGQNISRDRAEMLGIEIGDTYGEAKQKLEKLALEGVQSNSSGKGSVSSPVKEERRTFRVQIPGASQVVAANYVSKLKLDRKISTSGNRTFEEYITVHLSAPSSGAQVLGLERFIKYEEADQPRLSEVLLQLKAKFRSDPQIYRESGEYIYQFNDGQPYVPNKRPVSQCSPNFNASTTLDGVEGLNRLGDCDVVLFVSVNLGISSDHLTAIRFKLGDNERIKINGKADFDFIDSYIKTMQDRTRGAPPKL